MNAAAFAQLIAGSRKSGRGYVGHCPAHEDAHESLSFADGDRGLLVKCHAGCSVEAITLKLGLRVADLFRGSSASVAAGNGHGRQPVAVYPYRDESGAVVYEVVRYEPKSFRQRRPDGAGGSTWNVARARRLLYRLPELQGEPVAYVVEGERDAEAVAAMGIPATTNAGGAGKWTEDLTGQVRAAGVKKVVILADNDQAGENHARSVARSCLSAGLAVKLVRLPGLPPKGDVSDWLAAAHTREELVQLVKATPVLTPADLVPNSPVAGATTGQGAVVVCLADVEPESVSWVWPGRIAAGKLTLILGDPDVGKSALTLDVAARITRGLEWPDGGMAPMGDVVLLTAEDGLADTVRPRLDAAGGDPARVHVLMAVRDAMGERPVSLVRDLTVVENLVRETQARLLLVDPVSAYLGETNSWKDAEVRALLAPLAALAERCQLAVVAVMHPNKNAQQRALYRAGGSLGFVAAARVVLAAGRDPEDEDRRLLVKVKNNLVAELATISYRFKAEPNQAPRVEWERDPIVGVDADSLLGGDSREDPEERREADQFLRQMLGPGERRAVDVFKAAQAHGISDRTVKRAKRRLRIASRHAGQPGKQDGAWYWSLPELTRPQEDGAAPEGGHSKSATNREVAPFGETRGETSESARTSPKGATCAEMAPFDGPLRDSASASDGEEFDAWPES